MNLLDSRALFCYTVIAFYTGVSDKITGTR